MMLDGKLNRSIIPGALVLDRANHKLAHLTSAKYRPSTIYNHWSTTYHLSKSWALSYMIYQSIFTLCQYPSIYPGSFKISAYPYIIIRISWCDNIHLSYTQPFILDKPSNFRCKDHGRWPESQGPRASLASPVDGARYHPPNQHDDPDTSWGLED